MIKNVTVVDIKTGTQTSGVENGQAIRNALDEFYSAPPSPFPQSLIAMLELLADEFRNWSPELCSDIARTFAKGGTAVTPSLVASFGINPLDLLTSEALLYVPNEIVADWRAMATSEMTQIVDEITKGL